MTNTLTTNHDTGEVLVCKSQRKQSLVKIQRKLIPNQLTHIRAIPVIQIIIFIDDKSE